MEGRTNFVTRRYGRALQGAFQMVVIGQAVEQLLESASTKLLTPVPEIRQSPRLFFCAGLVISKAWEDAQLDAVR